MGYVCYIVANASHSWWPSVPCCDNPSSKSILVKYMTWLTTTLKPLMSVWRVALSNWLQPPRTQSMNILQVYDISYFGVTWHDATWGVCLTLTLGGWWSAWRVGGGLQPMHPFWAPRTMVTTHNAPMLYIMQKVWYKECTGAVSLKSESNGAGAPDTHVLTLWTATNTWCMQCSLQW